IQPLLISQSFNPKICDEGDCPKELFTILLNEPLKPDSEGQYSADRTEKFKAAYLEFQQIKTKYTQKDKWKKKRQESQLSGKSCLRHYQLESQFGYEYVHNSNFKAFVDANQNTTSFTENGFQSSRKGLNLQKRMSTRCPEEIEDLKSKPGPALNGLPDTYQKLGRELGYFDEDGKLMKPLEQSSPDQDLSKMSKKKQVNALKEKLSQMPFTQAMNDKVSGIAASLNHTQQQLNILSSGLGSIGTNLGSFIPNASGLLGKSNAAVDQLSALKDLGSKFPKPDLFSSIGSLFGLGSGISNKAKNILGKANDLKSKFDDLTKKSNNLKNKFDEKKSNIDGLKQRLDDMAKKKAELETLLADKPKKILDHLKKEVPDVVNEANDILNDVVKETKEKGNLSDQLNTLDQEREQIEKQLKDLEQAKNDIENEFDQLEQEKQKAEDEVDQLKQEQAKINDLKEKIENLDPEKEILDRFSNCDFNLKSMFASITGLDTKQEEIKNKLTDVLNFPNQLTSKLSNLSDIQKTIQLPQNGIPIADNLLQKANGLLAKTTTLTTKVENLNNQKSGVQEKVENLHQSLDQIKGMYENKTSSLFSLKDEFDALVKEKTDVKKLLDNSFGQVDQIQNNVTDFIDRFSLFSKNTDCDPGEKIKQLIEEYTNELDRTVPELDQLSNDIKGVTSEANQLELQTKQTQNEVREYVEKAEELKTEQETLSREYGTDVNLEPVSVEEWSESFEIERPYWEAVFHPDDEVVEGQIGRYFEVKLKDADQNVKLLFGPGEYCMSKSDFRKKYGSTIGSFVTEALHSMKTNNQEKVKLFIQGSADIVGQETFSGKLDKQFYYKDIAVLPQKDDPERFSNTTESKIIPEKNFRNTHLPDLRAQYLKEMIKAYSRKFDPVVLEGVVKDIKDEEERNAIIYLYLPTEILQE
ncbi:MAG: hypothetical protein P1U56_22375, partial [Saprospiraceae bacterium]|nr:hypothetical protein [Saprospiraceae bacterium]